MSLLAVQNAECNLWSSGEDNMPAATAEAYQERHLTIQSFLPALEGLRGAAALMVFFLHQAVRLFGVQSFEFAYLCVDFFFILSGFILSRHYENRIAARQINFRHFAMARFARLYPMYLTGFLLIFITTRNIEIAHAPGESPLWSISAQLLMLQALVSPAHSSYMGIAWSTSVEWIVNLLFFAALYHFRRIPTAVLVLIIAGNIGYLLHYSLHLNLYVPEHYGFNATIARGLTGFCTGYLIFRLHRQLPALPLHLLHGIEAALIAILIGAIYWHGALIRIGIDYIFILVLFPVLLMMGLYRAGWITRFFSSRIMVWLGRISYSVYILHFYIENPYLWMLQLLGIHLSAPWYGMGYVIFVLLFSTATWFFIEDPLRLKRRVVNSNYYALHSVFAHSEPLVAY